VSFGSRGYWHLIPGAPSRDVELCAQVLLAHYDTSRLKILMPKAPGKCPDIARAMALELGVEALSLPAGVPPIVMQLVEELCPAWVSVIFDPSEVYSGLRAGRGKPRNDQQKRLKIIALHYDLEHIRKNGRAMSAAELARLLKERIAADDPQQWKKVTANWGKARDGADPDLAKTVTSWRRERLYALNLDGAHTIFAMSQNAI
jgi:hypothetical protein